MACSSDAEGVLTSHVGLVTATRDGKQKLRIINPAAKIVTYSRTHHQPGSLGSEGSLTLHDLDGNLVCHKYVTHAFADALWRHVWEACDYEPVKRKVRKGGSNVTK